MEIWTDGKQNVSQIDRHKETNMDGNTVRREKCFTYRQTDKYGWKYGQTENKFTHRQTDKWTGGKQVSYIDRQRWIGKTHTNVITITITMVFCRELAPVIPMLLPGAKRGNPVTEKNQLYQLARLTQILCNDLNGLQILALMKHSIILISNLTFITRYVHSTPLRFLGLPNTSFTAWYL